MSEEKEKSIEIVVILDRSGSMCSIASDVCGEFDHFIAEQRKLPGKCSVTLVQFNTGYEVCYSNLPIDEVGPLRLVPNGSTALYDAMGKTITDVGARLANTHIQKRPDRVVIVVLTDGENNASHEYTQEKVAEMISHQREKYSWEFIYMGTNQDAQKVATGMCIPHDTTITYASSKRGARAAIRALNMSVAAARSGDKSVVYDRDAYDSVLRSDVD